MVLPQVGTVRPANVLGSFMAGSDAAQRENVLRSRAQAMDAEAASRQQKETAVKLWAAMSAADTPEKWQAIMGPLAQAAGQQLPPFEARGPELAQLEAVLMGPEGVEKRRQFDRSATLGEFNAQTNRMNAETARGGLALRAQPEPGWSLMSADELAEAGRIRGAPFPPGVYQRSAKTGEIKPVAGTQAKGGITVFDPDTGMPLVTTGDAGAEFGRKTTNALETDIAEGADLWQRGANLMKLYDPTFLTYRNQGEAWLTKQAEKLGIDPGAVNKEMLKKRTKFRHSVEQLFNQYRKEITGAAAAVQELERLMKSFINVEDSPSEFEAGLELFLDEGYRALRLKRRLLREGVSGADAGRLLDELFLSGEDDDWRARASELRAANPDMDPAEARSILEREGYAL